MGCPLDPLEWHSLKLGIGNYQDKVLHLPSQEGKWKDLNFHKL